VSNFLKTAFYSLLFSALLFVAGGVANGQTKSATTQNDIAAKTANLIDATKEYKASSTELLALQQKEVNQAEAKLSDLRPLVSEGLVAKVELEAEEQKVAALRAKLQATQKQINDSDSMIVKIKADEELAKKQAATKVKLTSKPYGAFNTSGTILRSSGAAAWSLGSLYEIQTFFATTFGHSLPTSAVGQSGTHNRLGYDHRNAVDVALHPDSSEGRALIAYLQIRGIPFLAFRGAIPGVATGPHIHIGSPSHRLA
jgi:hypothetical protein